MESGGAPDISFEARARLAVFDMTDVPYEAAAPGVKPRILFAISDTGGGHRSGAQAIAAAIEQQVGEAVDTYIIDIFAHTGVPVVRNAPVVYDKLSTRWLPLYDALYRLTDGRRRIDALTGVVYLAAHRNILRVLEAVRPTLWFRCIRCLTVWLAMPAARIASRFALSPL